MRRILFAASALLLVSVAAGQDQGLITCWYNADKALTGGDAAAPGAKVGVVVDEGGTGDYAYSYTIQGSAADCPRALPK